MRDRNEDRNHQTHAGQVFDPPAWLSSAELEDILLEAIQASVEEEDSGASQVVDEYFARDESLETEVVHRQALLKLLGLLWPHLADLLGGPPAE